jgi:hypothetical protein
LPVPLFKICMVLFNITFISDGVLVPIVVWVIR